MTFARLPSQAPQYRTIVADPPWHYGGFANGSDPTSGRGFAPELREPGKAVAMPYPEMELSEIAALPVSDWADTSCRLFLWATNRYLPTAISVVLPAWAFMYRQTLVWRKTGNPNPLGGSVAPNHAEFLIVAVKGSPARSGRWASSVIDAPKLIHSSKPDVFGDLIERVSPGPYLEMFARRQRLGWDTWGNEALQHVELSA